MKCLNWLSQKIFNPEPSEVFIHIDKERNKIVLVGRFEDYASLSKALDELEVHYGDGRAPCEMVAAIVKLHTPKNTSITWVDMPKEGFKCKN